MLGHNSCHFSYMVYRALRILKPLQHRPRWRALDAETLLAETEAMRWAIAGHMRTIVHLRTDFGHSIPRLHARAPARYLSLSLATVATTTSSKTAMLAAAMATKLALLTISVICTTIVCNWQRVPLGD